MNATMFLSMFILVLAIVNIVLFIGFRMRKTNSVFNSNENERQGSEQ
jgi:hypothetical protein